MITNLEEKLKGTLPVTREELFKLVSSWGRIYSFISTNDHIEIKVCKPKDCYPLENLDVSQIEDLSDIFGYSFYNGNLSKWNISNVKNMEFIFYKSEFNNDSLKNWNTSKVEDITAMFYGSKFNGNVSKWDISNIKKMNSLFDNCPFDGDISKWKFNKSVSCYEVFNNEKFSKKYNNKEEIPKKSLDFLKWFEKNRLKIANLNVSKDEILEFDDYLSNFESKELINDK